MKKKIIIMSTPMHKDYNSFEKEYLGVFESEKIKNERCGDCIFFVNGCTTSQLENKYGNANTPACSEFKIKLTQGGINDEDKSNGRNNHK